MSCEGSHQGVLYELSSLVLTKVFYMSLCMAATLNKIHMYVVI